jgi:hypothetical protein
MTIFDEVFTFYNEWDHQFLFLWMNNGDKIKTKLKGKGRFSKTTLVRLQNDQNSKITYASLFKAVLWNTTWKISA